MMKSMEQQEVHLESLPKARVTLCYSHEGTTCDVAFGKMNVSTRRNQTSNIPSTYRAEAHHWVVSVIAASCFGGSSQYLLPIAISDSCGVLDSECGV